MNLLQAENNKNIHMKIQKVLTTDPDSGLCWKTNVKVYQRGKLVTKTVIYVVYLKYKIEV